MWEDIKLYTLPSLPEDIPKSVHGNVKLQSFLVRRSASDLPKHCFAGSTIFSQLKKLPIVFQFTLHNCICINVSQIYVETLSEYSHRNKLNILVSKYLGKSILFTNLIYRYMDTKWFNKPWSQKIIYSHVIPSIIFRQWWIHVTVLITIAIHIHHIVSYLLPSWSVILLLQHCIIKTLIQDKLDTFFCIFYITWRCSIFQVLLFLSI